MMPVKVVVLFVLLSFFSFASVTCSLVSSNAAALYDEPTAINMLSFASFSYCGIAPVSSWSLSAACAPLPIQNYQLYKAYYNASSDALGFISFDTTTETIVVAFKGTKPEDLEDWIDDLDGAVDYADVCQISSTLSYHGHLGFCDYYLSMKSMGLMDDFIELLKQYPDFQIFATGHSLGGAAAAIFAADLASVLGSSNNVKLVTFGQPRVGDITFDQTLQSYQSNQVWRLIHDHDLVPHLAPCCLSTVIPYNGTCSSKPSCPYHNPTEIWYSTSDMTGPQASYTVCSSTDGEDEACSDAYYDNLSIEDHLYYFDVQVSHYCCT